MAHTQQANFCHSVKNYFPQYFNGVLVLDIGSLDINGNNQFLFSEDSLYLGVDVAAGRNVDIITPGHLLNLPPSTFDVIVSTECLEHDKFYINTLQNIEKLLKPGGLFILTCATTGRPEHGTLRTTPSDAPLLQLVDNEWGNHYKNITESDIRSAIDVDKIFSEYVFSICEETHDLYFYGIKCGKYLKRLDYSWMLDTSSRRVTSQNLHTNLHKVETANEALRAELNSVETANEALRAELNSVETANEALRNEILDLFNSRSWRATYPMRLALTKIRRYRQLAYMGMNVFRHNSKG